MRIFILLLAITTFCYGQSSDTSRYSLENVIKITVRKHKNKTTGTRELIANITRAYDGQDQQLELIRFYKSTFDYKVIDKEILANLIDSLSQHGINENVREIAKKARNFIEHRFLGKRMKDFEFPDKDGILIELSSLNDKIVIIELWASWCAPCVKEMPKIPELRTSNSNIEFYSISLDKDMDKMKKFVNKTKYDWPIVFGGYEDINAELWEYLNIVAIPKYYTVDRNGIVINVADHLDTEFIKNLK